MCDVLCVLLTLFNCCDFTAAVNVLVPKYTVYSKTDAVRINWFFLVHIKHNT